MSLPESLKTRLSIPAVAAPLFIISNPDLVIAQCKAGVVGSFPSLNARPAETLEIWLQKITQELDEYNAAHLDKPAAPFAVKQIVHNSNDRLEHDLELCVKYKARRDIWGCGQGIGAVKAVLPTSELVARLEREYLAAREQLLSA